MLGCLANSRPVAFPSRGHQFRKIQDYSLDQAAAEYAHSFRTLWHLADFFVVNVSSPNTPNLRQLQDKAALDDILAAMQTVNAELSRGGPAKPVLVKVAPDLTFDALDEIVSLVGPRQLAGLVATNTTLARPEQQDHLAQRIYRQTGGLSGRPLATRSTEVVRHLYRQTRGTVPIIGVGGIFTAADAWEKLRPEPRWCRFTPVWCTRGPGSRANWLKD